MDRSIFIARLGLTIFWIGCLPTSSTFAVQSVPDADANRVRNPSFADWQDGHPVGWSVEIGASNGANSPASEIRQGGGPSLELRGDLTTKAWKMVSQTIEVQPQQALRLSYVAKATGVKREGNQFDNCYVGVFFRATDGRKRAPRIWTVTQDTMTNEARIFRVPALVNQIQVIIFLSKTGTLNVTDVELELLESAASFDILIDDMARNYSFLEHKNIDWPKLTERYRQRAINANSPAEFSQVITEMLAELRDVHTWVVVQGQKSYPFNSNYSANYDFRVVDKQLIDQQMIENFGTVGRTKNGLGYARIVSLDGIDNRKLKNLNQQIGKLIDASGFILDLRSNSGGSESVAGAIAGIFTNQKLVYGRQVFRSGEAPEDFHETEPRVLWPAQGKTFAGPIVCLIGPGAVSSTEGFAMMMKANPNCTLVGQPTRGASGNPAPVELPNGVDVWYSRWKSLLPDGTPIEGVGVQPDILVEHVAGTDAAFEKAIEILSATDVERNP